MLTAAFSRMIQTKAGHWIVALLLALGLGFATHAAVVTPALDTIREMLVTNNGGGGTLGAAALQWMGFLNFDKAITMILSAYGARATLRGAKAFLAKR
jgi:hypothetical protein